MMKIHPYKVVFLSFLLLVCFAAASEAETIGFIVTADVPYYEKMHESLVAVLEKAGYGRKGFIIQRPAPNPLSWSNAARKLIASDVSLLVTYGSSATLYTLRENPRMPVVYVGLHESLLGAVKGRKATGTLINLPTSSTIRYLRASSQAKTLGVIYNGFEEVSVKEFEEVKKVSESYGFTAVPVNLNKVQNLAQTLDASRAEAYFLTSSALVSSLFAEINEYALSKGIPTVSLMPTTKGEAIITMSADASDLGGAAGEKAVAVLKGAKTSEIKPVAGGKTELVVNIRDAQKMGLRLSMDLVAEATRIIY